MDRNKIILSLLVISLLIPVASWANTPIPGTDLVVVDDAQQPDDPAAEPVKLAMAEPELNKDYLDTNFFFDPTKYTLGPDDQIEISVQRHPEFSGVYPVNLEGKIQYKFVGDIEVSGLNKTDLEEKLNQILSTFVINPEINVTILEYKSKVIYILGEVGAPGKYYMRSESIPVRQAVVNAGLPTHSASMRRCLLITPAREGKAKTRTVDLFALLYGGDLNKNVEMKPGEVLYVPCTVLTKVIRAVTPATDTLGLSQSTKDKAKMIGTGF